MCEARNASGAISAQYFALGETISGTSYFYSKEYPTVNLPASREFFQTALASGHPAGFDPVSQAGSIREMTDSSGNVQAEYSYDPYGRVSKLQGSVASDFQYGGYYYHSPSGLSLAVHRQYDANLGRWLNRDPIFEIGGVNLYSYVRNNPVSYIDPLGLQGAANQPCLKKRGPPLYDWGGGKTSPEPPKPRPPIETGIFNGLPWASNPAEPPYESPPVIPTPPHVPGLR
jgi:RHS repeat-associated protein